MGIIINLDARTLDVDGITLSLDRTPNTVTSSLIPDKAIDESSPRALPVNETRADSRIDSELSRMRERSWHGLAAAAWGWDSCVWWLREEGGRRGCRGRS